MSKTIIALKIIRDNAVRSPKEFARLMWPNSEGWHRVGKVGHGSHRGVGMYLAGGGFLGKLRNNGLITGGYHYHYILTEKGRKLLIAQNACSDQMNGL